MSKCLKYSTILYLVHCKFWSACKMSIIILKSSCDSYSIPAKSCLKYSWSYSTRRLFSGGIVLSTQILETTRSIESAHTCQIQRFTSTICGVIRRFDRKTIFMRKATSCYRPNKSHEINAAIVYYQSDLFWVAAASFPNSYHAAKSSHTPATRVCHLFRKSRISIWLSIQIELTTNQKSSSLVLLYSLDSNTSNFDLLQ